NNGENDSEVGAEFKKDTKKPHGIRSAGDCQAKAVSGFHQVQLPDLLEDLLGQSVHENMVQPGESLQLPGPFQKCKAMSNGTVHMGTAALGRPAEQGILGNRPPAPQPPILGRTIDESLPDGILKEGLHLLLQAPRGAKNVIERLLLPNRASGTSL